MDANRAILDAAYSHFKNYIGILFVLIGFSLQGQTVDREKALEIANKFVVSELNERLTEKSATNLKLVKSENFTLQSGNELKNELKSTRSIPAYYIINMGNDNGFVVIAADKRANPILGYSTKGSFNTKSVPEQLDGLLNHYKEEIMNVVKNDPAFTIAQNEKWESLNIGINKSATSNNGTYLVTSQWNQDKYYNASCPEDSRVKSTYNGHVPVGCVSVSLSQLMRYWEWPKTGQGEYCYTPSGSGNYGEQCANFETTFDYANMPDKLSSSSPAKQKEVVAQFLYDVAIASKTTFNYNGSSASSSSAKKALIKYFKYSPKAKLVYKNQYSEEEWVALLKEHIDNNIPLYYRGDNNGAFGHAFICDGYDNQNRFHFNWGWGGSYDGFFALDAVKPVSTYNLNFHQGAVINIFPDNEDYTVEGLMVDNNNLTPESMVTISYTQAYKGFDYAETTPTFTYFLSEDNIPDVDDIVLGEENVTMSISSKSFEKNVSFEIPVNTAYGQYYIIVVADSKNKYEENNENNNIAYKKISVSEPIQNDFLVTDASLNKLDIQSGAQITVTCKQVYEGNAGMEVGLKSGYYLSTDKELDDDDILLAEELSSLSLSKNYEVESQEVRIPSETPAGIYYILFVSDHTNEYVETKEDNNLSFYEVTIEECGDFLEPNNSSDFAYNCGDIFTFMHDNLCIQAEDEDWFSFNINSNTYFLKVDNVDKSLTGNYGLDIVEEDGVIYIETFQTNANSDTRITLYDNKMNIIESDDDSGENKFSKITFNPMVAGPLDLYGDGGLNIYPNPTRGKLFIDTNLKEISEEIIVTILDTRGAVINQSSFTYYDDVDLSSYPRGEYIISLSSDTGLRQTKKVIKN